MVAKKETNNSNSGFVKDWWSQFNYIEEFETRTLQAFDSQREWIEGTKEQINQFEENSKKMTTEWKTSTQSLLENYNKALGGQNYQDWLNKLEEIGHKSQAIATLPSKASLELLSKSTDQLQETFANTIAQNQKMREKTTNAFEGLFDQWQQTQPQMFKFFDYYATNTK
ncbi:hypothetical protein [Halalkalibacter okhensis]|uniref:Polyhydroxyalkanoic acid inclusion protein PhaP n=1 Tax=Halalkalibacter okhensis TaxID=333138 RepID=A0A0B0ID86_9BACI|nr:hypothetical protein [Halalkalibacter okhensis]KHF40543.1 hypothetical protein LQ50_08420 [Halalkalibacter okhensis]